MRTKIGLKVLAILIVLVIVASSVAMYSATDVEKGLDKGWRNGIISFVPPSFISIVSARDDGGVAAAYRSAFPEDEAGLSAYVNTKQTIDLEKIKTTFTEVEEVGDNYIIGIAPIPDFGGDINVTVYADTSGWIVAYFKKGEPAAMLMQWGKDTDVNNPVITEITTTTLKDAIYAAAIAADIQPATLSDIKYYDFEFPNANGMMLFIRTMATDGANIVQVELPTTYTLYDASYYHYAYASSTTASSKLKIDETQISNSFNISNNKWWRAFDSYRPYLTTGILHTMEISHDVSGYDSGSAGVATVLIYNTEVKTPSTALVVEGVRQGATNISIFHHGGDTIVNAFDDTYWGSMEIRINGVAHTNDVSLNNAWIASGNPNWASTWGVTDFECGDILKLGGLRLQSGDSITVVHIPTRSILQRVTVM